MAASDAQVPDFEQPGFMTALLGFVAAAREGTATENPLCFSFACWLAGAWEQTLVGQCATVRGISEDEARAWFEQMLGDQRAMWGMLAATGP